MLREGRSDAGRTDTALTLNARILVIAVPIVKIPMLPAAQGIETKVARKECSVSLRGVWVLAFLSKCVVRGANSLSNKRMARTNTADANTLTLPSRRTGTSNVGTTLAGAALIFRVGHSQAGMRV